MGTLRVAESWASCNGACPALFAPSDSSTIMPGAGVLLAPLGAWSRAARAALIESPIAVPSCGCRASIARLRAERSVIGGTRTDGLPDSETRATLYAVGRDATNDLAAVLAASSLVGCTSVAVIDCDTSMTSTIVCLLYTSPSP